ncbi:MAG: hypothetical protein IJK27_04815 [Bacilli bacterium]|nr:hypothetical protein [Bacilli bacterium]
MNIKRLLLLISSVSLLMACNTNTGTSETKNSETKQSDTSALGDNSNTSQGGTSESGKVIVPAHQLKDNNPPINVNAKGEQVSESTWNSFKNGTKSKFNSHYNLTYTTYSGGVIQVEKFTKNGYHINTSGGELYYEKSGSTTYCYIRQSNYSYLRTEQYKDFTDRYTEIFTSEIKVHMFEKTNYEFDSSDGRYYYYAQNFGSVVEFKNGYLTRLEYGTSGASFTINSNFDTVIDIPQSYYMS